MPQFKKKPLEITAIQWTGDNIAEIDHFAAGHIHGAIIKVGDWIIRGAAGEFYPCKPEIFIATYDPA